MLTHFRTLAREHRLVLPYTPVHDWLIPFESPQAPRSTTAWYDAGIGQRVALNSWSHLTFVVSGGIVKIYLNGQVVFSGSNFPNVFGVTGNKGFGLGVNFWDTPFKGMLDEVTIYSEAISAEDVLQLYQQSVLP